MSGDTGDRRRRAIDSIDWWSRVTVHRLRRRRPDLPRQIVADSDRKRMRDDRCAWLAELVVAHSHGDRDAEDRAEAELERLGVGVFFAEKAGIPTLRSASDDDDAPGR